MRHLLLSFLMLSVLFVPSFAWLDYRSQRIPISSTTAENLTSYKINPINISYLSGMQPDFDDIFPTDVLDNPISYKVKSKVDSEWAMLQLDVTITNSNGTQLYIYFDNNTATNNESFESALWDVYWENGWALNYWDKKVNDGATTSLTGGDLRYLDQTQSSGLNILTMNGSVTAYSSGGVEFYAHSKGIETSETYDRLGSSAIYKDGSNYFSYNDMKGYSGGTAMSGWGISSTLSSDASGTTNTWYMWHTIVNGTNWIIYRNSTIAKEITLSDNVFGDTIFLGMSIKESGANDCDVHTTSFNGRLFVDPEPTFILGFTETRDQFIFNYAPTNPHIEENVTFTCANCADHNKFYWDFDDGSDLLYLTTNVTVGNVYSGGGSYNVTLIATNSTGVNETTYNIVTVTEPDIYVWLNDTLNDEFLSSFTLTVWNSTDSFNFSTSGAFATWNYTSGPSGNVSLFVLKDGYNTTTESAYISNSTDLNYTASASPAMLRLHIVDYDYRNVPVPISLSLTNVSTSLYDSTDYILFDSIDLEKTLTGTWDECSTVLVGQMFKYRLFSERTPISTPHATSYANSTIILTNEDETYNLTIDYTYCLGPDTCSNDETRVIYLSKDGTYKILGLDGTSHDTGVFPYFPAKAIICSKVFMNDNDGAMQATTELYKVKNIFSYFLTDANMTLGAVNLLVGQETGGSFGYLQNLYSPARRYFNILSTSSLNETIYMVSTAHSATITMNVVDNNGNPIEDAVVTIYKLFDSDLEIVGGAVTDSTGTVQFYERVGDTYYFSVVASEGTESGTILLISGGVTVSVRLSSVGELAPGVPSLDGVTISFTPSPADALYESECYWFNLTVLDTNSYLNYTFLSVEYVDMNLSILNTSTSSSGAAFSNYLCIPDLNTSNQIYLEFGFWHGANASVMGYYTFSEIYYIYESSGLQKLVDMVPTMGAFKWVLALVIIGAGYATGPLMGFGATLIAFILKLVELDIMLISGIITVVTHLNSKEGL